MRRGLAWIGLLGMLAVPASASADHHLIKVSEVYPGSTAVSGNDAFVELQMYAGAQSFLTGHEVHLYAATGTNTATASFAGPVGSGQNQRSVLIGAVPGADLTYDVGGNVDGAGGAVCFVSDDFGRIDCAAWGSFGNPTAGLEVGSPAPAIPDAQSLTRLIAPGCATLLEAGDDTNDSATDFALTAPTPRNNATAPTETACAGGGGADTDPPQTTITKAPDELEKAKAKIKFRSSEPGSDFRCKLDRGKFKPCDSPFAKRVDLGKHRFKVFAIDAAGNRDPRPAKARFKRVDG